MKFHLDQGISESVSMAKASAALVLVEEEESMDCRYEETEVQDGCHDHVKEYSDENDEAKMCNYCLSDEIQDIVSEFILDDAKYEEVAKKLLQEMEKGLSIKNRSSSDLRMFKTYVRSLPNGTEKGNFLALDLGGTNFRVLLIKLDGKKDPEMLTKIYPIAHEIMVGQGSQLFDYIAECIAKFMEEHTIDKKNYLPLGFTFSFPCKQVGLTSGTLTQWTKGFKCEGVEGKDVVKLLHEAITRRGDLNVECVAILNDTVGCLMSCAFKDHNTELGVILGTGTNACYMEKIDRVEHWDGDKDEPKQVIINTEWGAFGDGGCLDFLRTQIDKDIDTSSINPSKQIYEKMISGMYMGEVVRRIVVECVKKKLLFNGDLSKQFNTPDRFYTKFVSEVEKDDKNSNYSNTQQVLDEMGVENMSSEDCRNVQFICSVVSTRAAFLASCGIASVLNRINKPKITVAVDGSLYRFHPHFHDLMVKKIQDLINPGLEFSLMLSEDGSGKGAALVAAVAHRLKDE